MFPADGIRMRGFHKRILDFVQPFSAPFALKTLELIINNRLHVKKIGTHEDGGYLFNSIVPLKFTENSETA